MITRAWMRPTIRAIVWWPTLAVALTLLVVGAAVRATMTDLPEVIVVAGVAAVAALVPLAAHDPARSSLHAISTTPAKRLLRRIALAGPVIAGVAGGLAVLADVSFPGHQPFATQIAPGLALAVAGLAVYASAVRYRPEQAAEVGSGVAMAWAIASQVIPHTVLPASIGLAWQQHPWPVIAVAALVTISATRGIEA